MATGEQGGGISVWQLGDEPKETALGQKSSISVEAVAFVPGESVVATVDSKEGVRFWDVRTRRVVRTLPREKGAQPRSILFSPDGKMLAVVNQDYKVELRDATTGQLRGRLTEPTDWNGTMAFSQNGASLATTGNRRAIHLWDVATAKERFRDAGGTSSVRALHFLGDSSDLAIAKSDGSLEIVDGEKGTLVESKEKFWPGYGAVAFSATGGQLASAEAPDKVTTLQVKKVYGAIDEGKYLGVKLFYGTDRSRKKIEGSPFWWHFRHFHRVDDGVMHILLAVVFAALLGVLLFVIQPIRAHPTWVGLWLAAVLTLVVFATILWWAVGHNSIRYLLRSYLDWRWLVPIPLMAVWFFITYFLCRRLQRGDRYFGWAAITLFLLATVLTYPAGDAWWAHGRVQKDLNEGDYYGGELDPSGTMQVGTCKVTVPKTPNREMGRISRPKSYFYWEGQPDKVLHFTLETPQPATDANDFALHLASDVKHSPANEVFLFVHGYNVSFEYAAYLTAQMAVDLSFPGPACFFSWPSKGAGPSYLVDHNMALENSPSQHLVEFIKLILSRKEVRKLHLIAHSMGNEVLLRALKDLRQEIDSPDSVIQQVVLAAPDVDGQGFQNVTLPWLINRERRRVTLYASSHDDALSASYDVWGSRRAGDSTDDIIVYEDLDSVDASTLRKKVNESGHSYIMMNPYVLQDLAFVLEGVVAPRFFLDVSKRTNAKGVELPYYPFKIIPE